MSQSLRIRSGGSGDPVLLLLHGIGAAGDVWRGFESLLPINWPGRWVTPDLPGHGSSKPLTRYTFPAMAAAVATAVPPTSRLVVLGHSLGGVVALSLAGGSFGVHPAAVCGLGIKIHWTDEELARATAMGTRPTPVFPSRAAAAERYLKVAGLVGLVTPGHVGDTAVRQTLEGFSHAFDPGAFAIGAFDMPGLIAAAEGTVVLAAGARDPMCGADQMRALVGAPVVLPDLGHNAHVENPAALLPLLAALTRNSLRRADRWHPSSSSSNT